MYTVRCAVDGKVERKYNTYVILDSGVLRLAGWLDGCKHAV
jgi:hypothetical protein